MENHARLLNLFHDTPSLHVGEVLLEAADDPVSLREKLARIVLDEMYQFASLLDAKGNLLEVNRAALEGGGMAAQDVLGRPFWEAHWWTISREAQEHLKRAIARAAAGEFVRYDVEVYGSNAGRDTIVIDFSIKPVRDRHGNVVFLLPEGRNITEKKQAEAEIARKNAELQRLLERVKELDELKSRFFANVSHELRTPLALILGPAEKLLAGNENLTAAQRRDLEIMRRNAATLLKQVNQLLDLSKLDAGRMTLAYVNVDLARLVRVAAGNFDSLAAQREITFSVEAPAQLPAQVDPEKLERVLLNLLSNALKFTPASGRVRCALEPDGRGGAVITVQDTGPGVRPELRQLIFERFRQGEGDATRRYGGTGLGLAIVKELVELHHGTVGVTEAPGGGALFQVTVPLTAPAGTPVRAAWEHGGGPDAVVSGTLEELRPVRVEPLAPGGPEHLPLALVVEDNPEMLRFIAESLASELRVAAAGNGREGLEKVRALRPDVLITDIMMPGMSGDQLVAAIRAERELDPIPILVLSARADDELRLKLLREGTQDYVVKPFAPEELRARARNLAMVKRVREQLEAEVAMKSGDLELLARAVLDEKRRLQLSLEETRVARESAERSARAREHFLQLVSHELRTPLTAMELSLEILRRQGVHRGNEQAFERLASGAKRLGGLVTSLLEWARIKSGRLTVQPELVDPTGAAAQLLEELEPLRQRRALTLRLDAAPGLGPFPTDPYLFQLILSNLVGNALKYTDAGSVEVGLRREGDALLLSVSDTGPGIPPEDRRRIFEPFEQLQPMHQKSTPGVGLGLALVKEVVESLRGSIELTSPEGGGSRFTVRLPPLQA